MEKEMMKRIVEEHSSMRSAAAEALADLSFDGVPHLTPGEMQHRVNLAIFTLRKVLRSVPSRDDALLEVK